MSVLKKARLPIVVKLVTITLSILLAATLPIAFKASERFEKSSGLREGDMNDDQARVLTGEVESLLKAYLLQMETIGSTLHENYATEQERQKILDLVFKEDEGLVNVEVWSLEGGNPQLLRRETREKYLKGYDLDRSYIETVRGSRPFPLTEVFSGRVVVRNSSLTTGAPLLTLGRPLVQTNSGNFTHVVLADVRLDRIQQSFSDSGSRSLFLVDDEGTVLAHSDDKLALDARSFKEVPIVAELLESPVRQKQIRYFDGETSEWQRASFAKNSLGLSVIAQASEDVILEPARQVKRDVLRIAGIVLSVSFFFIFIFSFSLTTPIEKLVEIAESVARGNFEVRATVKTRDEVEELGNAFNHMIEGLKERDKVKNVLNKFHGSSITEDLLKGDVGLGGSRKDVVVFFSDIRDFTKFSEGHTPEEVVEMLNEYFQIMVGIVVANHGVVDKFVGDAMMAIWGAPQTTGHDEECAVRACLQMRAELEKLNAIRVERGQTEIKIGMGLHAGPAISGTIGSTERMEYTVIGDTVNMASRVESSTKAFGSDLLVTEALVEKTKERFVFDYAGAAEVKGKSEPIKMYKVRGYLNENGETVLVRTKYSDYEAGDADKVKIAS